MLTLTLAYAVAAAPVRRVRWSPAALADAVRRREPVVLTHAPSSTWSARREWHDGAAAAASAAAEERTAFAPSRRLRDRVPFLRDALRGAVNWNWDRERALCRAAERAAQSHPRVPPPEIDGCHSDRAVGAKPRFNVSLRALASGGDGDGGEPMLYMGRLEDEFAPVAADLDGWHALAARDVRSGAADAADDVCHIWIGSTGMTTHTHYDMSHNVYAPIAGGAKRFLLWPPSAWPSMHLFPRAHPGNQKSQIPAPHESWRSAPIGARGAWDWGAGAWAAARCTDDGAEATCAAAAPAASAGALVAELLRGGEGGEAVG